MEDREDIAAEAGPCEVLAEELDGRPMVGAVPTRARLGSRLHLGYRHAETTTASPAMSPGALLGDMQGLHPVFTTYWSRASAEQFAST